MQKCHVMIFPAGSEIGLEINRALKYSKFVKVYGATSVRDHSEMVYENLITDIPFLGKDNLIEKLNVCIQECAIDYIYPAYDAIQIYLMEHQDEIRAKIVSAPYETVKLLRSKKKTYQFFRKFGEGRDTSFIPKTWDNIEDVLKYPVFVKPAEGQGSEGAMLVTTKEELIRASEKDSSLVICEYLSGEEYTVDCFTDRHGNLIASKLRKRMRIRMGIAVRSEAIHKDEEVLRIAQVINSKIKMVGAWFFQLKKNCEGEYKLLEISPRIPGTCGLSRNMGINFPLLTLFCLWGEDVSIIDNEYGIMVERAFYSSYKIDIEYETVYLDYDDTLILDNRVNILCMTFIYQALQKGKKIVLLSKHGKDLLEDLSRKCIDKNIFSKIIILNKCDEKYKYITEVNAIFIDDSFAERKKVKEIKNIPVFDVDMIESLIDYRQ